MPSIFDAIEAIFRPLLASGAKLRKLALERLPIGGYAGIADEPFFGVEFRSYVTTNVTPCEAQRG